MGGLVAVVGSGALVINRSYYSGSLNLAGGAGPNVGCLVGLNFGTLNIADSNFNSTLCVHNAMNYGGYAGATGLATAALQTATPFTNWLGSVWIFANSQNPKLIFEP